MNKRKTIYFLSAIVLIIGCYALNLSYSLFVQTEEREIVESIVPNLSSSISIPSITLKSNEEYIIKESITNTGTVAINYSLNSDGNDYEIKLLEKENNSLYGTLEPNETNDIYLYIKNNKEEDNIINFNVLNNYTTLDNNLISNISDTELFIAKKSSIPYYDKKNTLAYHIMNNYVGDKEIEESLLTYEEIDNLTKNNNEILLPIYNDNVVSSIDGNIYKTYDNDGISYYYNNTVDNNYVKIGDNLFRIVRINGNGTTRLISNNIISTSIYNDIENDLSYKGTIKESIDKWYEENLKDYSELLSDEIFCVNNKETLDVNTDLICNEDNIYTVSKEKLMYPIGLLSSDEVVFAGFDGYLKNQNIWTMTSYKNNEIFVIKDNILATSKKSEIFGVRPVINIKSDIIVESGDGTENSPYIIINN